MGSCCSPGSRWLGLQPQPWQPLAWALCRKPPLSHCHALPATHTHLHQPAPQSPDGFIPSLQSALGRGCFPSSLRAVPALSHCKLYSGFGCAASGVCYALAGLLSTISQDLMHWQVCRREQHYKANIVMGGLHQCLQAQCTHIQTHKHSLQCTLWSKRRNKTKVLGRDGITVLWYKQC